MYSTFSPVSRPSRSGFTLIEIILVLALFGMVAILSFEALANIGIARLYTTSRANLESELHFFSERLTTMIKESGTLDYEEYWNRSVVGTATATGHYLHRTGYGNYGSGGVLGTTNYGSGFYYCRSLSGTPMGTGGCLTNFNVPALVASTPVNFNYTGKYQRYGQYVHHFTDYNGNKNNDPGLLGDEDSNGNIRGDEDDLELGDGPVLFAGAAKELYLYDSTTHDRTFFRLTVKRDPNAPTTAPCNITTATGTGCIGNIEILRLSGKDYGLTHNGSDTESYNGSIDTWVCHPDWIDVCTGPTVLGSRLPSGNDTEWIPLFPGTINVKDLSFEIFPKKDPSLAWSSTDPAVVIHPYIKIRFALGLSWERRKNIKNNDPTIRVSTTLNLTQF